MQVSCLMPVSETGQRSDAPKIIISAMLPVTTDAKPGTFRGGAAPVLLAVLAAEAVPDAGDGVVSPSVLDALPRTELSISHNWRRFFTSEGKFESVESNTAVWFVLSKLEKKKIPPKKEKSGLRGRDRDTICQGITVLTSQHTAEKWI